MKQRENSTGIVFDLFILAIPIVLYIKTQYFLFIFPVLVYGSYVLFNQLKVRHEQQVFIEPKKLNFYKRGRNISLFLVFVLSALIEIYALYVETAT
jgi:hypothetical protein